MDEGYCIIEMIFDEQHRPVDYRFLEVNSSFERQSGMRNVFGRRMLEFVSDIEEHWLTNYGKVAVTGEPIRFANEYKSLGRWFDVYAFRAEGWGGREVAVLFKDITEPKRAEAHRELLINELNHRVKNTLATVQSFASQTLRNARSMAEARSIFDSRLMALAKAHDVLTREHWEGADLNEVIAASLAAYSEDGGAPRLRIDGPELRLQPKSALTLSMAVHELATNAVKYGAFSNNSGTVEVNWSVTQNSPYRFHLRWIERGGPPVEKPRRRGFGSRLLEDGLAQDIAGEVGLHFERAGLVCTIDAPLAEVRGEWAATSSSGGET